MLENYKEYLYTEVQNRKNEIENTSKSYDITRNYSKQVLTELKNGNKFFAEVICKLEKHQNIDRAYVARLYNNSDTLYEGFVTTLFWGNLNKANLLIVRDTEVSEIKAKLVEVNSRVKKYDYKAAFDYMNTDDGHIRGIGISFFTKILYFMGYDKKGVMPLIYDKWTQCVHAALMISEGLHYDENDIIIKVKDNGTLDAPAFRHPSLASMSYLDYIRRMAALSSELSLSRPDKLEEFVFGYSKKNKSKWNASNPRFVLTEYLCSVIKERCHCSNARTSRKKTSSEMESDSNNYMIEGSRANLHLSPSLSKLINGNDCKIAFQIGTYHSEKGQSKLNNFINRGTFQKSEMEAIIAMKRTKEELSVKVDNSGLPGLITITIEAK